MINCFGGIAAITGNGGGSRTCRRFLGRLWVGGNGVAREPRVMWRWRSSCHALKSNPYGGRIRCDFSFMFFWIFSPSRSPHDLLWWCRPKYELRALYAVEVAGVNRFPPVHIRKRMRPIVFTHNQFSIITENFKYWCLPNNMRNRVYRLTESNFTYIRDFSLWRVIRKHGGLSFSFLFLILMSERSRFAFLGVMT